MRARFFVFVLLTLHTYSSRLLALTNQVTETPPQVMENKDWLSRYNLAVQLGSDHGERTFLMLLRLLVDKNEDVSYAAAEAIESRGDIDFDAKLIQTISSLPRERRWYAYRAEAKYPTRQTIKFLLTCLEDESRFYHCNGHFDDRNSFYIANSLLRLLQKVLKIDVKSPAERTQESYDTFLQQVKTRVSVLK